MTSAWLFRVAAAATVAASVALVMTCPAPAAQGSGAPAARRSGGADPVLVIAGATIIDATGASPAPGTTILIRDDRIEALG